MTSLARLATLVLALPGVGAAAWLATRDQEPQHMQASSAQPRYDLRECPHSWAAYFKNDTISAVSAGASYQSPTRDIPEYGDCQRFLVRDSTGSIGYDSLFAIFAFENLDSLESRLLRSDSMPVRRMGQGSPSREQSRGASSAGTEVLARQQAGQTSVALAAAYVYAEGDYAHLGIGRGGNCLYVWLDGPARSVWHAKVHQLGPTGAAASCLGPQDPHALAGKELKVKRAAIEGFTAADYPPVARWDYDATARAEQQYIGLTCGAAWCEIGDLGFRPSAGLPFSPSAPASVKRVRAIKGWYDQQYLATLPATANEAGPPDVVPTTILGTFIPDPRLQQYDLAVHRRFVHVGSVLLQAGPRDAAALAKYKRRLGLEAAANASTPQWNEVYVCHRGSGDCGVERNRLPQNCLAAASGTPAAKLPTIGGPDRQWVAMIVGAVSHDTTYLCTYRYDVPATLQVSLPGGDVPGTTRWRWLAEDEGFWNRCASLGCCETLP